MKNQLDEVFERAASSLTFRTAAREHEIRIALACRFDQLRRKRGLSIRDLAREMQTSVSQVERLLNKEVGGGLTLRTLVRAADVLRAALDVSLEARTGERFEWESRRREMAETRKHGLENTWGYRSPEPSEGASSRRLRLVSREDESCLAA